MSTPSTDRRADAPPGIVRHVPILFVVDGLLVVAHLALGANDYWNLDKEHNLPTWFSGGQLLLIAVAALACFDRERHFLRDSFPPRGLWALAAAFFLYLSLDETTVLHERVLRHEVRDLFPPDSLWISLLPWQLVFGPFLLIAAIALLALFTSRFAGSPSLHRPAIAGLGCWVAAVLAEALSKPLFMVEGLYAEGVAIEEGLELVGATALLLALTRYAESLVAGRARVVGVERRTRRLVVAALGLVLAVGIGGAAVAAISLRNSAWLYRHNAQQLAKRDRHVEAIAAYARALERRGDDVESLRGLARAQARVKRHEDALATYDRALALRPSDARLWNGRGAALHELERFADAEASYRRALDEVPRYARAIANLGLALEVQGRRREAEAEYRRALEIDPHQRLARARIRRFDHVP